MNLDNLDLIHKLDKQNMLSEINALPEQLEKAWKLGQSLPLPDMKNIRQIVISGMGGSAIGADLLSAYIAPFCAMPVIVQRDYDLPAFAKGAETLFIASSHSGNTEETLSSFDAALKNKCALLVICTGGKLAEKAAKANIPMWKFAHSGQPRAAVGFSFGLLLALFTRLVLIPAQELELSAAVKAMKSQQVTLRAENPAANNSAKRYAGQMVGRWVTVFGAGHLAPVARRIKGQINELAKAPANFEFLPEANHNTLAGILNPAEQVLMPHTLSLFLGSVSDHPRNRLRTDFTRKAYMLEGMATDVLIARGTSRLEQMWTALHFGDYLAFYLAIAYGVDPTPVDALVNLKNALATQAS